ncbi:hypothetical protein XELAEV_18000706mg [Xenopus laevis]|uniref:Secreted protein n=1 Tax=Xenopus laevis TaxID=8355 RepID=A0A974BPF0_XENLA|nr:hypothetical protein XELAEV_18000706mg [Xenopus laevis]
MVGRLDKIFFFFFFFFFFLRQGSRPPISLSKGMAVRKSPWRRVACGDNKQRYEWKPCGSMYPIMQST